MTRIANAASRLALAALACAACKSDPPPPADWVRPWSAWDLTKWPPVCGSDFRILNEGRLYGWGKPEIGEPPRDRRCVARVEGGNVDQFIISVDAPRDDVARDLQGPVAALVEELPPDVGQALTRMVKGGRSSRRVVRGFDLEIRYENSALGRGLVDAHVYVVRP